MSAAAVASFATFRARKAGLSSTPAMSVFAHRVGSFRRAAFVKFGTNDANLLSYMLRWHPPIEIMGRPKNTGAQTVFGKESANREI